MPQLNEELSEQDLTAMDRETLESTIRHHNHLYWDEATAEISDYDYDRLVRRLQQVEPDSPVLKELGPSASGRFGKEVVHQEPMLSLDKCYEDADLLSWAEKFAGDIVVTPKMDGIAASLRYDKNGRLQLAATRGNGVSGDDITVNALTISDIPRQLPDSEVEVRGEIYMKLSVFSRYEDKFSNPRNLTAGAIKHKEAERCRAYGLSFAAFDYRHPSVASEAEKFARLQQVGFPEVEYRLVDRAGLSRAYQDYEKRRPDLDFEIDGVVFKANQLAEQQRLGHTAHHPRFAMAYKFQGDSKETVLKDVEWSVARTGTITPVALTKAVTLSGASVTRVSLHNAGYVEKLALSRGATIMVTRRGGVIPHVEHVTKPGSTPIPLVERCPSCAGGVGRRGDFLFCLAPEACPAAIIGTIAYYCSVTDIQGFGEKLLQLAFAAELLHTPADLYRLNQEALERLERVGPKLAAKLIEQINDHRQLPLATFLLALGIADLGKVGCRILEQRYQTLERIREVSAEELAAIPGIGDIIAKSVVQGLADRSELIDQLLQEVSLLKGPASESEPTEGGLGGSSFVFTGKLIHFDRKAAQREVRALGGTTPDGVSKELTFLVVGAGKTSAPSGKEKKAHTLIAGGSPIKVIAEGQFRQMLDELRKENLG